jgi:WD40 repeat protein
MKHDGEICAVMFSPDGTKIVTAGNDNTARLWDAAAGKPLGTPMMHDGPVLAVAFSPDGTKIATASADNTARLWDVATGRPLSPPMKHDGQVFRVAFSPDGAKIATASADNTARIWYVPRSLPDDPAWVAAYAPVVSGWKEDEDGMLHPLSADAAAACWAEVDKSPAWLEYRKAMLEESRQALHESEAAHWEAEKNAFATAFHLRWLAKQDPNNAELPGRLRHAEAEWAKTREQMKQQENQARTSGLPQPAIPQLLPGTQAPPTAPNRRPSTQAHSTGTAPPTSPGAPASTGSEH